MSQTTSVAQFEVKYYRYLDPAGKVEQTLPDFAQNTTHLQKLYKMMLKTRVFDTKAITLQRTGKLGTYPSTLGQEAIAVGIGAAMHADDVLCPYYREYGAQFWRGVTMENILLYWGGDEQGSNFEGFAKKDFPICVPIASQTLHGVGVASALQYKKTKNAVVTTVGDGGTSRGDFYEAMNVAGIWNLPIVFVINNNQWAISVPRSQQTKAQTLAQKGIAAGLSCVQIDGNDVIAVQDSLQTALTQARSGKGATVIEALTYRMCDHTTADDASRYRPPQDLEANKKIDPILRLKNYMMEQNSWNEDDEKSYMEQTVKEVNDAVERYLAVPINKPHTMFDYLYAELPRAFQEQYDELKARV
ncbi:MAG TPA: pyruvate dehydrogenase (acetyl-transferring) E1 component subunit alpha [Gammaproteobacteria bacterium]|nr:pyruvate dehydrogenase (acetyl-transferring) E1 component subunit alpha [Gammaproteobacteria bacterium]